MVTRAEIVTAAKSYEGVRFRHRGRDRIGMDCVGLLVAVCNDLGLPVVDFQNYKRVSDAETFRDMLLGQTDESSAGALNDGSIVLLRQAFFPCHCGIISITNERCPMIIHASIGRRVVAVEPWSGLSHDLSYVREFKGIS